MNSSESTVRLKGPVLDWPRQAGKVDLLLEDIETKLRQKRRKRRRVASTVASVLVLAALAIWAVPFARQTDRIATSSGSRQTIALADGSTAELNAQTELRTDFRYGRRSVHIAKGEAFFSVTKDENHPFLVITPAGTVRVTGTQFNVRLEDSKAEVTLLEGGIALERDSSAPIAMTPGDQFTSATNASRRLSPEQLSSVTSWRQGRLVLDGMTLSEAASRFASYHGREIDVAPDVAPLRMGGSCQLDDLPGFLEFLPKAVSVNVLARDKGPIRIVAR